MFANLAAAQRQYDRMEPPESSVRDTTLLDFMSVVGAVADGADFHFGPSLGRARAILEALAKDYMNNESAIPARTKLAFEAACSAFADEEVAQFDSLGRI